MFWHIDQEATASSIPHIFVITWAFSLCLDKSLYYLLLIWRSYRYERTYKGAILFKCQSSQHIAWLWDPLFAVSLLIYPTRSFHLSSDKALKLFSVHFRKLSLTDVSWHSSGKWLVILVPEMIKLKHTIKWWTLRWLQPYRHPNLRPVPETLNYDCHGLKEIDSLMLIQDL